MGFFSFFDSRVISSWSCSSLSFGCVFSHIQFYSGVYLWPLQILADVCAFHREAKGFLTWLVYCAQRKWSKQGYYVCWDTEFRDISKNGQTSSCVSTWKGMWLGIISHTSPWSVQAGRQKETASNIACLSILRNGKLEALFS